MFFIVVMNVDNAQLRNWRTYLDFEASNGDELRTIFLYERCVIACAQYEEFWLKVRHPSNIISVWLVA